MENTWEEKNNTLAKDFRFSGFNEAVSFVNKVAELANKADHHPDILIHGYSNVEIRLSTHSAGSTVTEKDHDLAEQIDKLV
ncbi:4a-hydroxytetrahydrobiopterin dehydratase [Candidatus Falkowbacteria bacterium]|nr:4a-hydroxytetrahydrobiopterin dehydratase [Candidatus Falkowbacteria bacterium]